MTILQIIFWLLLGILFYCYLGYGALIFFINKCKALFNQSKPMVSGSLLPVTVIVPAYNESELLPQKIRNCLELSYPRDRLHIIFITDGSTDESTRIIGRFDGISLLHQARREGKSAAIRRAMRFVTTPIVVFTDANSMLNADCLRLMVRHYVDPRVGGVAGEKMIVQQRTSSTVSQAEGMYWQYESFMKQQESDFYTVLGAAGELFSMRTELFSDACEHLILDDLFLSMQVCSKGKKVVYEKLAIAAETGSLTLEHEENRKVRIATGVYEAIFYLALGKQLLKSPVLYFQYFSRRLLRWLASPFIIPILLMLNVQLAMGTRFQSGTYTFLLLAQVIWYLLAIFGRICIGYRLRIGVLAVPFYFCFMNYCLLKGLIKYANGQQTNVWKRSVREAIE